MKFTSIWASLLGLNIISFQAVIAQSDALPRTVESQTMKNLTTTENKKEALIAVNDMIQTAAEKYLTTERPTGIEGANARSRLTGSIIAALDTIAAHDQDNDLKGLYRTNLYLQVRSLLNDGAKKYVIQLARGNGSSAEEYTRQIEVLGQAYFEVAKAVRQAMNAQRNVAQSNDDPTAIYNYVAQLDNVRRNSFAAFEVETTDPNRKFDDVKRGFFAWLFGPSDKEIRDDQKMEVLRQNRNTLATHFFEDAKKYAEVGGKVYPMASIDSAAFDALSQMANAIGTKDTEQDLTVQCETLAKEMKDGGKISNAISVLLGEVNRSLAAQRAECKNEIAARAAALQAEANAQAAKRQIKGRDE